MRTIDIMGNKISEENISNSDMLLTIQTDKTGLLETEKLDDCYKYGYRQTIENMDKIKRNNGQLKDTLRSPIIYINIIKTVNCNNKKSNGI